MTAGLATTAAVAKLKARADKNARSKYYLRMNPLDNQYPPVGMPVREVMQQIYGHKRGRTVLDLLLYLVYVIVFVAVLYQINDSKRCYEQSSAVYQLLVDQEISPAQWKKGYLDLNNWDDYWTWVDSVFVPNLYPTQLYPGREFSPPEQLFVAEYLRVVEGARIRQLRARPGSCTGGAGIMPTFSRAATPPDGCFSSLTDPSNIETRPFGPASAPTKYKYYPP